MITKELIKSEVDKVRDEYLGALYRIVKAFEEPGEERENDRGRWTQFVAETYGSMASAPIERGEQGEYEVRPSLA